MFVIMTLFHTVAITHTIKNIVGADYVQSPDMNILSLAGMCLEKRAFFRIISGMHSSINIHLTALYRIEGTM